MLKVLFYLFIVLAPICLVIAIMEIIRGKRTDATFLVAYLVTLTLVAGIYFLMLI